jgi:hypothetical protein
MGACCSGIFTEVETFFLLLLFWCCHPCVRVVESKEQRAQAIDGGKLSSLEPGRALPFPETPDERKVGNAPSLCFREGNVLIASFFLPKEDATHRMYH